MCLCMSVAELMEKIGVNKVLMYVSVRRISHLSLTSVRLGYQTCIVVQRLSVPCRWAWRRHRSR